MALKEIRDNTRLGQCGPFYRDSFGNWCSRLVAPAGRFILGTDTIVRDPGVSDPVDLNALQHQVQHLPTETLLFLLGSRYCETDRLSDEAWRLFGHTRLANHPTAARDRPPL